MEESDEVFDAVIRYGLYLVAIFQLVCITTVFLLTDQSNDSKVIIKKTKIIYINYFKINKINKTNTVLIINYV